MKETDILMGRFAELHLESLKAQELDEFENLLQESDNDLLSWIQEQSTAPNELIGPVFKMIINFRKSL